jgi:hypothetical protein
MERSPYVYEIFDVLGDQQYINVNATRNNNSTLLYLLSS